MRSLGPFIIIGILLLGAYLAFGQNAILSGPPSEPDETVEAMAPVADPVRGKALFVSEACVVCHSIRGVGGKAGPPMDVTATMPDRDPMEFAARMWMGAPVMLKLQDAWMGYQIDLTGEELRDLAAFANNPDVQDSFTEADVPDEIRAYYLDQFYIEDDLEDRYQDEEWFEFSRRTPGD